MKSALFLSLSLVAIVAAVGGAKGAAPAPGAQVFDFRDPVQENAVAILIDSPLKPVVGYADGISGTATFDPARPEATKGTIRIAVSSIRFPNPGYTASARGYGFDEDNYPEIVCTLKRIKTGRRTGPDTFEGTVETAFTIKGVTRPLTIPLQVQYLPGKAKERDGKMEAGDLLAVRSTFTIRRSDFGVAEEVPLAVCGDRVEIRVAVVGATNQKPPAAEPAPESKQP